MPKLRDRTTIDARLYTRGRGARYYADFRDYADVGGAQEALCPPGSRRATEDATAAAAIAEARLTVLEHRRRDCGDLGGTPTTLRLYAARHLRMLAATDGVGEQWLASAQVHLARACDFFGDRADLAEITVRRCTEYVVHLCALPNGRGGTLSGQSVCHHLNSLSRLLTRSMREGILPLHGNPIKVVERPRLDAASTMWLEIPDMRTVLAAAASLRLTRADLATPYFLPILSTYAYTGAREDEVLGLERHDVNLERGVILLRPNSWRPTLKTANSERPLHIFPEFMPILRAHLESLESVPGRLLYPGRTPNGGERMITDIRKLLDKLPMPERLIVQRSPKQMETLEQRRLHQLSRKLASSLRGPRPAQTVAELSTPTAEWCTPSLRTKMIRHSWCAARLQTLDRGQPIAVYTVAKELGHVDTKLVQKIYGHLGHFRCRSESVDWMREE